MSQTLQEWCVKPAYGRPCAALPLPAGGHPPKRAQHTRAQHDRLRRLRRRRSSSSTAGASQPLRVRVRGSSGRPAAAAAGRVWRVWSVSGTSCGWRVWGPGWQVVHESHPSRRIQRGPVWLWCCCWQHGCRRRLRAAAAAVCAGCVLGASCCWWCGCWRLRRANQLQQQHGVRTAGGRVWGLRTAAAAAAAVGWAGVSAQARCLVNTGTAGWGCKFVLSGGACGVALWSCMALSLA